MRKTKFSEVKATQLGGKALANLTLNSMLSNANPFSPSHLSTQDIRLVRATLKFTALLYSPSLPLSYTDPLASVSPVLAL